MTKAQMIQRIHVLEAERIQAQATIRALERQARILDQHITQLIQHVTPGLMTGVGGLSA